MKRVSKYQTTDGQLFDTFAQASQHEAECKAWEGLRDTLAPAYVTGRPEAVLKAIIGDPIAIRDILSAYIRSAKIKADERFDLRQAA